MYDFSPNLKGVCKIRASGQRFIGGSHFHMCLDLRPHREGACKPNVFPLTTGGGRFLISAVADPPGRHVKSGTVKYRGGFPGSMLDPPPGTHAHAFFSL